MFLYWMRGEGLLEFNDDFAMPDIPDADTGMTHLQLLRTDAINVPER